MRLLPLLFTTALAAWSQIGVNTGDLKIEPKYLGQTLDQISAAYSLDVFVDGSFRGSMYRNFHSNQPTVASLTIAGLAVGNHTVHFGGVGDTPPIHNFTVTQGTLTTASPELSALLGVIKGNLFVNGAPPVENWLFAAGPPYFFLAANTSAFRFLVPVGSRNGTIYRDGAGVIETFPYTALAGQETDVGTVSTNTGDLKIEPKYLGQTLDQISAAYSLEVFVDGSFRGSLYRNFHSNQPTLASLTIAGLTEGNHTVHFGGVGDTPPIHNVNVTQGALTTASPELSTLLGVIKGNLFVNGTPPVENWRFAVGPPYFFLAANTSAFRFLVPAGSRNGTIYRDGAGVIKTFPYTALAGQDVIVGDPFQLNLLGTLSAKSGPANARIWQYSLKNLDSGAVSPSVSSFTLTQTSGTSCTPVISTATPVAYGLIAPNATANANFTIDFSSCAATARFTLNVTATSGAVSQSFTHNQLFR